MPIYKKSFVALLMIAAAIFGGTIYNDSTREETASLEFAAKSDEATKNEEIATEDEGYGTPEGIIVGMNEEALNKAYGKADKIEGDSYNKEYEYYTSNRKYKMEFKVHNGVITKIKCEIDD